MEAKNVSATLCTHKGAVKISRGELINLNTPNPTSTHRPVAHSEFIDLIEERLLVHKISIDRCEVAVMNAGMRLFGTLVLKRQLDDFAFAMGFRAANDKSMAVELVAGFRVFCCDNMSLSGDAEVLWAKHSGGFNARAAIQGFTNRDGRWVEGGVDRAIRKFAVLQSSVAQLKEANINDDQAKATVVDALQMGIINQNQVLPVVQEYLEPKHAEFEPRTKWSLHNSFTEVFKIEAVKYPHLVQESTQKLGTLFSL